MTGSRSKLMLVLVSTDFDICEFLFAIIWNIIWNNNMEYNYIPYNYKHLLTERL